MIQLKLFVLVWHQPNSMNERIRLLAEQATVLDYSTWDSHNQKTVDHYKFDKEKFAELIIAECADVVRHYYIRGDELITSQHITRHFGIAE